MNTNPASDAGRTPNTDPATDPTVDPTVDPTAAADPVPAVAAHPTHLYVLLDRSGSMAAIKPEVIEGFNGFLVGQQRSGADARLTLVQFDTINPAETVIDDIPIAEVRPLAWHDFEPRGGTPLLDATGMLIGRARMRSELRAAEGRAEDVVFVTITDGEENASRELTRHRLKAILAEREQAGWTFVYLSAGLDAYADAASFGYRAASIQTFAPDAEGAGLAFGSLDTAVARLRDDKRAGRAPSPAGVWQGDKPAEADRRAKRGDRR